MIRNIALIAGILLVGCATTSNTALYLDQYIVMERRATGYEIEGLTYTQDQATLIIEALKEYPSKKVLLGMETSFEVGDVLALGPYMKEGGFEMYFLGKDGNVKQANFVQ
jgi:hypothetical protein